MAPNLISSLEVCSGAGGQAIGLEQAGFEHKGLVEIEPFCCQTLRFNRPNWRVFEKDLHAFVEQDAAGFRGVELIAGGLPCPPFSIAGKQLGEEDERNLFPVTLELIDIVRPRAVMIENVRGFLGSVFENYRQHLRANLTKLGYHVEWHLLNASDFGVPQLRPRVVIVALRKNIADRFHWPEVLGRPPPSVGEALYSFMREEGWRGADSWKTRACKTAPTIVGGSLKHGGPDLGPTRAKRAWASLGVDGKGIANSPPSRDYVGMPRLTIPMVARLQGFPSDWKICGRKTAAYRQVGNAFPPPVARAVGESIFECLSLRRHIPFKLAAG